MYIPQDHTTIEEVTNDPYMLGLIIFYAEQALVQPELVCGIIEAESGGDSHTCSYEALSPTAMQASRPPKSSIDTESVCQKMRWGLMQIQGATARRLGYDGWLSELSVPLMNLEWGIKYLAHLTELFYKRHGYAGVIAAYHSGNPRKVGNSYVNQVYVDKVTKLMDKYKPIIAAKHDEALSTLENQTLTADEADAMIRDDRAMAKYMEHTLEELKAMAAERGIEAGKNWRKSNYADALYLADINSAESAG